MRQQRPETVRLSDGFGAFFVMNLGKKRSRLILAFPYLIFPIVMCMSSFWLSDLFVELGLQPKDRFYINIVVIVTFTIGFFTSKLHFYLQKKLERIAKG